MTRSEVDAGRVIRLFSGKELLTYQHLPLGAGYLVPNAVPLSQAQAAPHLNSRPGGFHIDP